MAKQGAIVTIVARSTPEPVGNTTFVRADLGTISGCNWLLERLKKEQFDTVVATCGIIARHKLTRTSEGIEEDLMVSFRASHPPANNGTLTSTGAVSRFIVLRGLFENGCIVGRKRVFVFGYPGSNMVPLDDLNDVNFEKHPEKYSLIAAHQNTVVLNEALVYELAKRYPDAHVFGIKPGIVQTGIRDNVHGGAKAWMGWLAEGVVGLFSPSAESYVARGALPLVANPELDNATAKMFDPYGKEIPSVGWVTDEKNRAKAWNEADRLVAEAEYRGLGGKNQI